MDKLADEPGKQEAAQGPCRDPGLRQASGRAWLLGSEMKKMKKRGTDPSLFVKQAGLDKLPQP
jgi:hypothetical protein